MTNAGARWWDCRPSGGVAARGERGSTTAELAVALPALVLLLSVGLAAVQASLTRLQCEDAARQAVLAASRGEDGSAAGQGHAPPDATVSVSVDAGAVQATAACPVAPLGSAVTVVVTDRAELEPGVG